MAISCVLQNSMGSDGCGPGESLFDMQAGY